MQGGGEKAGAIAILYHAIGYISITAIGLYYFSLPGSLCVRSMRQSRISIDEYNWRFMETRNEINDLELAGHLSSSSELIRRELAKKIIGQKEVIDDLLACFLCGGHCLLIGVPGLAKTMLIGSLARCLDLDFNRIQFTPDLMPSDITGSEILYEDKGTGKREFRFVKGPVFSNIVLADEINRTPPKTQSALLQAMQEKEVTSSGQTFRLPDPFWVLATQNPIEQEGTYPLPEAQQDRFMFSIEIDYPDYNSEVEIVKMTTSPQSVEMFVLSAEQCGFQGTHLPCTCGRFGCRSCVELSGLPSISGVS